MRRVVPVMMALMLGGVAHAHLGNENDTEVRIYSDRMQVVTRASIPFAWRLLGDRAPVAADDAGKDRARPLLAAEAAGLFKMTAGGKELPLIKSDCQFEVERDVAFVLTYPRPTAWPVEVTARFFDSLTNLESGTVRVFDFKAARFNSDLDPLAEGVIHQGRPSLAFSLETNAPPEKVVADRIEAAGVQPRPEDSEGRRWFVVVPGVCAALLGIWLNRRRFRSRVREG